MSEPTQRTTSLPTGFGGSYDEYAGDLLSLDKHLIQTPSSTFFMRVSGENAGARIEEGDIIVIDKSLDPVNDDLVVAIIESEFAIRRFIQKSDCIELFREADEPSEVYFDQELQIWGVITASITQHRKFKS